MQNLARTAGLKWYAMTSQISATTTTVPDIVSMRCGCFFVAAQGRIGRVEGIHTASPAFLHYNYLCRYCHR